MFAVFLFAKNRKRDKRIDAKGAVETQLSKWETEVITLKKEKKSLYIQILEIREEVEHAEKS